MLASFPGGSPALKEIRAAYDGPIMLAAAFSGTFWLKATPHLSDVWVPAFGSSYGDDPRPDVNEFFKEYEEDRRAARWSTRIRSSATRPSRRSRRASRWLVRPMASELGEGA